ncbi:MAG TPA: sulfite exporter TauE/SafE family protein [Beijerinckiaceae bacterium]|nr:sulfite exporter TauE/SafE family protein [Beijerinckiaceae bacterium]
MIDLLPPGISPFVALALVAVSFATSALTAAFGIGGGVAMLGALASTVEPTMVVAVHAVVQIGSNIGRTVLQRVHVVWPIAARFTFGSIFGIALGATLFVALPVRVLLALIGVFILAMTWVPKPGIPGLERSGVVLGGAVSSVITMFVGATGPFINAMLKVLGLERRQMVATQAMCMTIQHTLKAVAFGLIGFSFGQWVPLMAAMIASGFAGTWLGTQLLERMSERFFSIVLKTLLTLIALDLLRQSLGVPLPF